MDFKKNLARERRNIKIFNNHSTFNIRYCTYRIYYALKKYVTYAPANFFNTVVHPSGRIISYYTLLTFMRWKICFYFYGQWRSKKKFYFFSPSMFIIRAIDLNSVLYLPYVHNLPNRYINVKCTYINRVQVQPQKSSYFFFALFFI